MRPPVLVVTVCTLGVALLASGAALAQSAPTIESLTGGKVKPGDNITAENLELIYTGNMETDLTAD